MLIRKINGEVNHIERIEVAECYSVKRSCDCHLAFPRSTLIRVEVFRVAISLLAFGGRCIRVVLDCGEFVRKAARTASVNPPDRISGRAGDNGSVLIMVR
jgi:hypothetical protein